MYVSGRVLVASPAGLAIREGRGGVSIAGTGQSKGERERKEERVDERVYTQVIYVCYISGRPAVQKLAQLLISCEYPWEEEDDDEDEDGLHARATQSWVDDPADD